MDLICSDLTNCVLLLCFHSRHYRVLSRLPLLRICRTVVFVDSYVSVMQAQFFTFCSTCNSLQKNQNKCDVNECPQDGSGQLPSRWLIIREYSILRRATRLQQQFPGRAAMQMADFSLTKLSPRIYFSTSFNQTALQTRFSEILSQQIEYLSSQTDTKRDDKFNFYHSNKVIHLPQKYFILNQGNKYCKSHQTSKRSLAARLGRVPTAYSRPLYILDKTIKSWAINPVASQRDFIYTKMNQSAINALLSVYRLVFIPGR